MKKCDDLKQMKTNLFFRSALLGSFFASLFGSQRSRRRGGSVSSRLATATLAVGTELITTTSNPDTRFTKPK
jgi:hypothetical protein